MRKMLLLIFLTLHLQGYCRTQIPYTPEVMISSFMYNGRECFVYKYLSEKGEWLKWDEFIQPYSKADRRRLYREVYEDYDHVKGLDYTRWWILESIKTTGSNVVWSRVFESDVSVAELKEAACATLESCMVNGDIVTGSITDQMFLEQFTDNEYAIFSTWKGYVRYEFREGRYRISVTNIYVKSLAELGVDFGLIEMTAVATYTPIYSYLSQLSPTGERYKRIVDVIDYNFCRTLYLNTSAYKLTDDW